MLRFNLLASVVPLAVAAVFARGEFSTGPRPCIEIAGASVQIAALSWQAERHVSFTNDPSRATVRVQISDNAEAADFAVIDDVDTSEAGACESHSPPQLVAISTTSSPSEPVIYLSPDGPLPHLRAFGRVFRRATPRPHRRPRQSASPRRRFALSF